MIETVEIFPWNDNFETGIPEIDDQHRRRREPAGRREHLLVHGPAREVGRGAGRDPVDAAVDGEQAVRKAAERPYPGILMDLKMQRVAAEGPRNDRLVGV
ncbi:MAG: hypothetical protein RIS35_1960 [Pseudomonadota bacterium]|jgi:CheY-like chemotaxis protein